MIDAINDIQKLAIRGCEKWNRFGHVSVKERGPLLLFNYTAKAQYAAEWTDFERMSRGLVINSDTGEIVARPFDKFFNWGEGGRFTDAPIKSVTEKMDGSLGILYRENGEYRIATRGSFTSDQALWATEHLKNYDLIDLPDEWTLLFEIIYPENRRISQLVLNYGDLEDLVLLAARNRFTGEYASWMLLQEIATHCGFNLPLRYTFSSTRQLVQASETLPANEEGWVVEFMDGQRFKFRGAEYRKLHWMISNISFRRTLEAEANGTTDVMLQSIPDEFLDEVREWLGDIQRTVAWIIQDIEHVYDQAPTTTRKEFALWVMENHKDRAPYLFARLDGKPLEQLIYKMAFKDR